MKAKDLEKVISQEKVVAGALLIDEPSTFDKWEGGQRVGFGGVQYPLLLQNLGFEKVSVKVEGQTSPTLEYAGDPVPVDVQGAHCKPWIDYNNGSELKLSITAQAVTSKQQKGGRE